MSKVKSRMSERGYTLIELIIIGGLTAALGTAALLSLSPLLSVRQEMTQDQVVQELQAHLREVQQKSISQELGDSWGIHFDSSGGFYQIFHGDTFETGTVTETVYLPANYKFLSPAAGNTDDIIFEKVTGRLSISHSIVIALVDDVSSARYINVAAGTGLATGSDTVPSFDFSMSISPGSGTILAGSSVNSTVSTSLLSGASESSTFSASNLPANTTADFSPVSCSPTCSSTMTLTTNASTPGGVYVIPVTVTNGSLVRTADFTLTVNTQTAPGAPTGLSASSQANGNISLSWTPPALDGGSAITNYRIYRSTVSGGETFLASAGLVTTYLDTGLSNGTTYYYKVAAENAIGIGSVSNEAFAVSIASAPGAPTSLTSSASQTGNQITLNWLAPSSDGGAPITNYKIYRGTSSGSETLLTTIGNVLTYDDTGLAYATTYYYKVSAVNSAGISALSNETNSTTAGVPSAPINPTSSATSDSVSLSWEAPVSQGGTAITNYKVYRGASSGSETLLVTLGNVLTYTDSGLTSGSTYYYKISAVNSVGESALSSEVSQLVLLGTPSAPTLSRLVVANGRVPVYWSAPLSSGGSAVTGYKIYRGTSSGSETLLATAGNVLQYLDSSGITDGTTYYYKVSAFNDIGEGSLSNELSVVPANIYLAFAGSTNYTSNLGGLSGADSNCQTMATNASLGGSWKAWLSDDTTNAASRLYQATVPYKLVTGTTIANNWTDLTNGTIASTLSVSEMGSSVGTNFWTGTNASGIRYSGSTCGNWTGSGTGKSGNNTYTNTRWTDNSTAYSCASGLKLYCFEQSSAPSAPQSPSATAGNQQVVLNWTAPSSDGGFAITNYKIYRGTTSGGETLLTTVGNVLTYTNTGLTNGTAYYYKVSAVNALIEGSQSSEVSATPQNILTARMFISSANYTGNLGGLSGADSKCQTLATNASLSGVWKAWLSDGATSASSRLEHNAGPYKLVDGATVVANNWADLTDGTLAANINLTESGVNPGSGWSNIDVWTNTTLNGSIVSASANCSNWSISDQSVARIGQSALTDGRWTDYTGANWACANALKLYCVEQASAAAPSAPQSPVANFASARVYLSWQAPASGTSISNYKIYRGTSSGSEALLATLGNVLAFTDTGVNNGTAYYYKISAVNPVGEGSQSSEVNATPQQAVRVFVTSANYAGASIVNLSGADSKCQTLATNASIGGNWKAWLSDSTGSASSRLEHSTWPYKLVNGTTIANNWTDLTDGTILSAINRTESNINPGSGWQNTNVWTNTAINGTAVSTSATCGNWTLSNSSVARIGQDILTDSRWTNYVGADWACANALKLYCFEQINASVPTAPQSLSATASSGQVVLNWQAPSSNGGYAITNYKIYRGTSSGSETLLTTIGNVLTYTDIGLTNGTTYYYKISAVNGIGESPQSAETSGLPNPSVPTVPQSLSVTSGSQQLILNWSAPSSNGGSAITNYKIYRGTSSGNETLLITISNVLTYTDTGLANGATYYYKVSAVNAVGESSYSNEQNATTQSIVSTAPQNLSATNDGSRIVLSWQAPADNGGSAIVSYKIYRSYSSGNEVYLTSTTAVSLTDSGLVRGTKYYYKVSAVNGVGESALGNEANATSDYRRAFVTNANYNGALTTDGNLNTVDANVCSSAVATAGLGGSWKAWIGHSYDSATARLDHYSGPYELINGTKIANNWSDLTDGSLLTTIGVTELGTSKSSSVWTNTDGSGFNDSGVDPCYSWTSASSAVSAGQGNTIYSTNSEWTRALPFPYQTCNNQYALYCFEQTPPAFKRVFVTSTTYTGNLGGLAGADSKCQARADASVLGGTWKAWLSDSSVSASSRLSHFTGKFRTINGATVANNWTDFADGTLSSPINIDEFGNTRNFDVWTNTTLSGGIKSASSANNCSNWTSTSANGYFGGSSNTNGNWTDNNLTYGCLNSTLSLYCVEQ